MVNECEPTAADPMVELNAKLAEVAPLAKDVAALREETMEQEAKTLEAILEKMAPLMPTLTGKIEVGYFCSGDQWAKERHRYAEDRGIVLIDQFGRECSDRDTRGEYVGYRLVLWEDGDFTLQTRGGGWSRWQGEPSEWGVTEEREFTTRELVSRFGLRPLVLSLTEHIDRVAEKLKERVLEYQERLLAVERVREALS